MKKRALITGITGQDGAYLAEFLLEKGYEVHGIKRRASLFNTDRIDHLYQDPHEKQRNLVLHYGDLTDSTNLIRIIQQVQPHEIYNLAAQSHVAVSLEPPEYTANTDAIGTLRLLEAMRILRLEKTCRFNQASTSELFGKVQETPQKETTPFYPRSLGIVLEWRGSGIEERGAVAALNEKACPHMDKLPGQTVVRIDPRYFRPTEVETLLGDPSRAYAKLGWRPSTSFKTLISEMVETDLELAKRDDICKHFGFKVLDHNE